MTEPRTIDVAHLPAYEISNQTPVFWGQLLIGVIECTMFLILIAAYFYVRLRMDVWPPPGDQFPRTLLPTLALIPLLASCIGSYLASEAAKKNSRSGMIGAMLLNLVLALIFFGMRLIEWRSLNFNWKNDAMGSYMWAFLGLHSFDVIADLIFTAVLIVLVAIGRCGPRQRQAVHVDSVVWYFLVAIWIPIYITIYWGPHLLES
jgi:cytochrome c oxidase subunit III